ncbi:MAG: MBL fold metallo-hydrolase [Coriobacteriaceae bacterium]|jgi:competence protein ComEC|nr:MBL fold metallo-hydrolase [Coriobacteriaceae bacterium]
MRFLRQTVSIALACLLLLFGLASCSPKERTETGSAPYGYGSAESGASAGQGIKGNQGSGEDGNDLATEGVGSKLRVRFLDVGQADAALLESEGHFVLIDGGNRADSQLVYTVLKNEGVTVLDAVIATHPDEDHIGGLAGALKAAGAQRAYCSKTSSDTKTFSNFVAALEESGISLSVPQAGKTSFDFGSAHLEFLGPLQDYGDENEGSLVAKVSYGEVSFLFTGDIGQKSEADLAQLANIESTVLKIPHHGSRYSSTYRFLRAVDPQYAVISVGSDNSYGHPTSEALGRLKDQGCKLYRTDLQGDVTMTTDGKTVAVDVARNQSADVYQQNDQRDEPDPSASPSGNAAGSAGAAGIGAGGAGPGAGASGEGTAMPTAPPSAGSSPPAAQSPGDEIVYVTDTGEKYHLDGCRYLAKSQHPMTRSDAQRHGYTPCSVCRPG